MEKISLANLTELELSELIDVASYVGTGLEANLALVARGGTVYDVIAVLGDGCGVEVRVGSYRTRECADRHGKEFCQRLFEACDQAHVQIADDGIGFQTLPYRVYSGTPA